MKTLVAVCAVAGLTSVLGCAASHDTTASKLGVVQPTSALVPPGTNKLAAGRDARQSLGLVNLPDGSRHLANDGGVLGALTSPLTPNLIERSRYWSVPGSVGDALAFVKAHPPSGARYAGGSRSSSPSGSAEAVFFAFPPLPGQIASRQVNVTVAVLPDGSTGVGAHAQDVWVVSRSPREAVPPSVASLDIRSGSMSTVRVTGWKLRRVVRWFNRLPTVQPGPIECGAQTVLHAPTLALAFRSADGRRLVQARFATWNPRDHLYSGRCNSILVSIRGRREMPLVGGGFLDRVQRLIERRLEPSTRVLPTGRAWNLSVLAPCTMPALGKAVSAAARIEGFPAEVVHGGFSCFKGWASVVAKLGTGKASARETFVFHSEHRVWRQLDRYQVCGAHKVPHAIYWNACGAN